MGAINGLKTAIADLKTQNALKKLSVILVGGYELNGIEDAIARPNGFVFVHHWQIAGRMELVESFFFYDAIDAIRYPSNLTVTYSTVAADPASPNRITAGKTILQTAKTVFDDNAQLDVDPKINAKLLTRNHDIYLYVGGKWISAFKEFDLTDAEVAKIKNVVMASVPMEANWLLKYARVDGVVIPYVGTGVL